MLEWRDLRGTFGPESYSRRPLSQVVRIVIHHSATWGDVTSKQIADHHYSLGWEGIGYHFVVHPGGQVDYVGDIGTSRAHVGNANYSSLGICLAGNFDAQPPTAAAIAATRALVLKLREYVPVSPVVGHRDIAHLTGYGPTSCPGKTWLDWRREVI